MSDDPDHVGVSSASFDLAHSVLVVGHCGTGKTTIVNMLFNDDYTADCCKYPQKTADTSESVTKAFSAIVKFKRECSVASGYFDAVGLGDPTLSDRETLVTLRQTVISAQMGFTSIIVVMRFGRVSDAERQSLAALGSMFADKDWKKHAVLVLTYCERDIDVTNLSHEEDRRVVDQWVKGDPSMKEFVDSFSRIVVTNNAVSSMLEQATRPYRQRCLKKLRSYVESDHTTVRIKPVTLSQLIFDILERYFAFYSGVRSHYKRIKNSASALFGGSGIQEACAGVCAICLQDISMGTFATLPCSHHYHHDCLKESLATKRECPQCRAHVDQIFRMRNSCRQETEV